jgi:hypothetical protein
MIPLPPQGERVAPGFSIDIKTKEHTPLNLGMVPPSKDKITHFNHHTPKINLREVNLVGPPMPEDL